MKYFKADKEMFAIALEYITKIDRLNAIALDRDIKGKDSSIAILRQKELIDGLKDFLIESTDFEGDDKNDQE